MKIYTRKGDDGFASLYGGKRLPKHHPRLDAYGTIDELISWIGLLRSYRETVKHADFLLYIQKQLMACAAALAYDNENPSGEIILPEEECVEKTEKEIDKLNEQLPSLKSFIIPGGNIIVSNCHITRCVCRRAERNVTKLGENEKAPEIIIKFLNRLSDYFFVLARFLNKDFENEDVNFIC